MRAFEFASSEAQLRLWKTISKSVLAALDAEAKQQSIQQAATAAAKTTKKNNSLPKLKLQLPSPPPPRFTPAKLASVTTKQTNPVQRKAIKPIKPVPPKPAIAV